jgi:hypothetical protein
VVKVIESGHGEDGTGGSAGDSAYIAQPAKSSPGGSFHHLEKATYWLLRRLRLGRKKNQGGDRYAIPESILEPRRAIFVVGTC